MMALSVKGAFDAPSAPVPFGAIAALAAPIGLFVLAGKWWSTGPLRGFYDLDGPSAIHLQAYRALGAFFLIEYWNQRLAPGFAIPAGVGDLIVGLSAPLVAGALRSGKPGAQRLALAWNAFGLLDLVISVSLGTMLLNGANPLTTVEIFRYPLSLIPTFFVPLSFILHLRSLQTLVPGVLGRVRAAH
jgi:hypothetical protein